MKHTVVRKQPNSHMCLVCGLSNPYGLFTEFFELSNGELVAFFTARDEHQSYPGRLHGGIITALLDETIGRAIMVNSTAEVWGVTVEFSTKFLKPIPLDTRLRVVGRIVRQEGKVFEGTGEILLPTGDVAATGIGKYVKLPIERIADFDVEAQQWKVRNLESDPTEVELGG